MSDTVYQYVKARVHHSKFDEARIKLPLPKGISDYSRLYKEGIICIQINRPSIDEQVNFEYNISYSFCSPIDRNKFSKVKARSILDSRMKHGNCVSLKSDKRLDFKEVLKKSLDLLKGNYIKGEKTIIKIPEWVKVSEF
jgi:hypothetical protein